ncbi:MAG: serine hydrolase [Candidatus Zixiibacteriota bacterium]|nr:MAG: serine hydrolase [candidate division Zixibacteria bacterium]
MKKARYFILATIGLLICGGVVAQPLVNDPGIEQQVDEFIASLPDEFNGTILLEVGDTVLLNKGYGLANRTYDIPNTAHTSFQIASMTKTFTAVLTIMLMREGFLDINATIDEYLPNYPKDKASRITINHLLHNRSGIKQHFNAIKDYFRGLDRVFHTPKEYIDVFGNEPLAHEPGEDWTYTTLGYWLLGIILEQVTGRTYAELVEDYIFTPLGMDNTFVENNLTIHKNMACGYKMGLAGYVRDRTEEPSIIIASGDIVSTTGDLFKFNRAMIPGSEVLLSDNDKAVLPKSEATIPVDSCDGKGTDTVTVRGLGTGSNYGFRSRMTRLLDKDACYIVLSNVHKDRAMGLKMYVFLEDLLLRERGLCRVSDNPAWDSMLVSEPITVESASLQAYTGVYQLSGTGEKGFVVVSLIGDMLQYQMYYDAWGAYYAAKGELQILSDDGNGAEFRCDGGNDVYFRIYHLSEGVAAADSILAAKDGRFVGLGHRMQDTAAVDTAEYPGTYVSVELQKAFTVSSEGGQLSLNNFMGRDKTVLFPLTHDIFGSDQGFFIFERYPDGSVRHFVYRAQEVDNYLFGSLFIKR